MNPVRTVWENGPKLNNGEFERGRQIVRYRQRENERENERERTRERERGG